MPCNYWLREEAWGGILLGNLDLLGTELLAASPIIWTPLLHHIGFVTPPYQPEQMPPKSSRYRMLTASASVRQCLKEAGMAVDDAAVVLPRSAG